MPPITDDKCEYCIPFILEQLAAHQERHGGPTAAPPFFIGINGLQGVGKTTLVSLLHSTLSQPPYNLPVAVLSIDDLYLTHADQQRLAAAHPDNKLVQHRGQPGTHDLSLGQKVFEALSSGRETKIPVYDKSQFRGQGDRTPEAVWPVVNKPGEKPVKIVIFEGWCVGFRALSPEKVKEKWEASCAAHKEAETRGDITSKPNTTLWQHKLEHLLFVNENLQRYDVLTNRLDVLIHLDAEDTMYVYDWRQQQEAQLRAERGVGMTPEEVERFVDGYYPAYELYAEQLRRGCIGEAGRQLRVVVDKMRKVVTVERL